MNCWASVVFRRMFDWYRLTIIPNTNSSVNETYKNIIDSSIIKLDASKNSLGISPVKILLDKFLLKKLNFINKEKIFTYKTSKFDKLVSSWGIGPLKLLFDKFLCFK